MVEKQVAAIKGEGDVSLVCAWEGGADGAAIVVGPVSSVMLRKASGFFKFMLASNRFKEGTELNETGAVQILLSDDHGADVALLCRIINFEHSAVPEVLGLERLMKIAKMSDKYDMGGAIRPTVAWWIRQSLTNVDDVGRQKLLVAAWLFQHGELFEQISESIALQNIDELSSIVVDGDFPDIFIRIFSILEGARTFVRKRVGAAIESIIENEAKHRAARPNSCSPTCCYAEKRLNVVHDRLQAKDLWPLSCFEKRPLHVTFHNMDNAELSAPLPTYTIGTRCDGRGCAQFHQGLSMLVVAQRRLEDCVKEVRPMIKKLCYRCVRAGKVVDPECAHEKAAQL